MFSLKSYFKKFFSFDEDQKNLLLVVFGTIFFTFFASFIIFTLNKNIYSSLLKIWYRWDTIHYIEIARDGYQPNDKFNIGFFPLYPFLIRVFYLFFRNYILSALIISNLAYIGAAFFLYKLVLKDFSKKIALASVLFFSLFPTAYFFHAAYSESLLVFLFISAFYYARKQKWKIASLLGLGAALTKFTGCLIIIPLFWEYFISQKSYSKKSLLNILSMAIIPFGFLYYLFINWKVFKSPFYFLEMKKTTMGEYFTLPVKGLSGAIKGFHWRDPASTLTTSLGEIIFVFLALFLIIEVFRRLRFSYGLFAALNWFIVVSKGFWSSSPRYFLWLFPVFIVMALITENKVRFYYSSLFASWAFYIIFLTSFIQGYWAW